MKTGRTHVCVALVTVVGELWTLFVIAVTPAAFLVVILWVSKGNLISDPSDG